MELASFHFPNLAVGLLAILAALLVLIQYYFTVEKDPREPPFLPSKIPVVGHLICLIREGADYFTRLEAQYHKGLYTLPILNGRMYMACSPEWAQAVHRSHKTLHFNTLVAQALKNLFCMDETTMELTKYNTNGENGTREGLMIEVHDLMGTTLAPGTHLDDLNKSILNLMAADVNQLAKGAPSSVRLWEWVRHNFSVASVTAVWGSRNPFALYPKVEPAFWEFEANAMSLMMMPMPHIFARKGWNARKRVNDAFEEYAVNKCYNDAEVSQLARNRAKLNIGKYEFSKRMYGYGEVSMLFGLLVNTIPAAFWLISWIFEDAQLLQEIRVEVDNCVTQNHVINATKLRTSCPLFSSAFRETLRLIGGVNVNRLVAEDTNVTNNTTGESYLLKKGNMVQIASNVIHSNDFWGSDAASFNPRRFMATGEKTKNDAEAGKLTDPAAPFRDADGKIYSSAFRSFGGGNNICPGRHFAQTEIMSLASLFVAGFEIENVDGSGQYKMPPYEDFKLMMSVVKPGKDVEVTISRRKGYEDAEWQFEM